MALHDAVRDLIVARGQAVVDDAEEFRGALDDFLTEDEASVGELNLLVDAVRLGAVRRLVTAVRQGATPRAAIDEAGALLARDRGTDDLARATWAVAVIGYGLGVVGPDMLAAAVGGIGTVEAPPRPDRPAQEPAAGEDDRVSTSPLPPVDAPATSPSPLPPPPPPFPAPVPGPVPPGSERRSGRWVLLVLGVAAVVGVVAGIGLALANRGDQADRADDPSGGGASGSSSDDSSSGGAQHKPVIPPSSIVSSYDLDGAEYIYAVNYRTGGARQLTDGGVDQLPTVSPDRSTVIYLERTETKGKHVRVLQPTRGSEPAVGRLLFGPDSDCYYGNRPAFSPDGTRFAITCTEANRSPRGLYIGDLEGNLQQVSSDPTWFGAPTWLDDGRLVVPRLGASPDAATTLWFVDPAHPDEPTPLPDGGELSDDYPDWSNEAGELLFLRYDPAADPLTQRGQIWTMDPESGDQQQLATADIVSHPAWSPDGRRIVCLVKDEDGVEHLAYVDVDDPGTFHYPASATVQGDPTAPAWGTR